MKLTLIFVLGFMIPVAAWLIILGIAARNAVIQERERREADAALWRKCELQFYPERSTPEERRATALAAIRQPSATSDQTK